MGKSKRRRVARQVGWVVAFLVVLAGAICVSPVLADPPQAPSSIAGGSEGELPVVGPGEVGPGGTRIPTEAEMEATLHHIKEKEEEAQTERETPQAAAERHASMTAYEGASTAEAEHLLRADFGETLETLNGDPARFLSGAKLDRTFGENAAEVTSEGETTVMEGAMPIEAGEGSSQGKVDLGLEGSADGWEPENPLVPVMIGRTAQEGIEVGEHITVTQVGAEGTAGKEFGNKNIFFGEIGTDTDQLVSPTARGVELFDQLRSASSPRTLRFEVGIPAGAELKSVEGGAAIVGAGGGTIATIPAPSATDAQEAAIPVGLAVQGDTVVLTLEPLGEVAYPILVDPEIDENLQWAWYFGNTAVMGSWAWAPGNSSGWLTPGYGDGSWPGTPGLFMWSNPGNLPGGSWGEWILGTPNNATYMTSVTVSPLWRNNAGCSAPNPYPEPYDFEGLWDGNQWDPLQYNQANEKGWAEMGGMFNPGWGKQLVIGMGTSAGGYIPCYRHIMIGGFEAWLGDWASPVIYAPSGLPSGWINASTAFTLSVPAYDEGLGVAKTWLSPEGAAPIQSSANCSGGYQSLCPHNFTGTYALNGTLFDQGEQTAMVSAESPTQKGSGSYPFTTKVDRSPPEVALTGQLAEATDETLAFGQAEKPQAEGDDELSLPTYTLTVDARDGSLASPATKRSGVKEIEVVLEGTSQIWRFTNASCPETSCPLSGTAQIKLTEGLSAGLHKVKIYATDFVGNKETREIEFEYEPATGMDGDGVLQHFPLPDGQNHEGEAVNHGPELAVNVVNGNLVFHQRDVNVEGPDADLEIERFYNSQLPKEQSSEWGRGWTLSQTPQLERATTGTGGSAAQPRLLTSRAVNTGGVSLPEAPGQAHYSAALHAMVEAQAGGGYAVTAENGETTVLNSAGKTTEVSTGPYSSIDYGYSAGKLSEVAVEDAASTTLPPSAYETTEAPDMAPTYVSSIGSQALGLSHPGDVALDAEGDLWVDSYLNHKIEKFNRQGELLEAFGSRGTGNGQFIEPSSVAINAQGDLWVNDSENDRLEEFTPGGEWMRTIKSPSSAAQEFYLVGHIAIDPEGHLWIGDIGDQRLDELSSTGEFIRSFGTTTVHQFWPQGLAFGPEGNIWVADRNNDCVFEFSPGGTVLRKFGTEGTGEGQFIDPSAITVDGHGDVWVFNGYQGRVEGFDHEGHFLTEFVVRNLGGEPDGPWPPVGLTTDEQGDLFVTNDNSDQVQEWKIPGYVTTYAASFGSAGTGPGQFAHPAGLARDDEGNLWVADYGNNRVEKFSPSGSFIAAYGSVGSAAGKFNGPKSIAFDNDGDYWVADSQNNRLEQFNSNGEFIKAVGTAGTGNRQFARPEDLAIAPDGEIWVADTYNYRIQVLNEQGEFLRMVNPAGMGAIEPTGIAFGPDGKVWVADWSHNRVVELTQSGELVRSFGTAGSGNGQFARPDMIAVDHKGNVWVVDQNNGRVEEFGQNGEYVAQFGSPGAGVGQFSFAYPTGIVADRQGDLWVADSNNNRVQLWGSADVVPEEAEEPVPAHANPEIAVATTSGWVSKVSGAQAGTCTYGHEGELLTSVTCPSGTTTYAYDSSGRMTKVTLPNGAIGEVGYDTMNRVTRVTVKEPGETTGKSTYFTWGNRTTVVEAPGQKATTYVIGDGGGVLKIYNSTRAPDFHDLAGTLYGFKETASPIEPGDQNLVVESHSVEGIASIRMLINGNTVVDEKTCEQNYEVAGTECQIVPLEWVVNTEELAPGIMPVEVVLTDTLGNMTTERFWVNIPYTPPPPPGVPTPPSFKSIQQFREEFDLDPDLNYQTEELAVHDRIWNLLGAWHNPQTPAGEVARASWERWGVPMRPLDVAVLEEREAYIAHDGPLIEQWGEAHAVSTYAGYWVDNRAGGIIRVGFTENAAALVAQMKSEVGLAAPGQVAGYTAPYPVTHASIEASIETLSEAWVSNPTLEAEMTELNLSAGGNVIEVKATNVTQVREILVGLVGPGVPLQVEPGSVVARFSGRYATTGKMEGGQEIQNAREVGCTAAAGLYKYLGKKANGEIIKGAKFLLTAGHCAAVGENIYRGKSAAAKTEGQVHIGHGSVTGLPRTGEFETDGSAVTLENQNIVPNAIYRPNQPALGVRAPEVMHLGEDLCFSGVMEKEVKCGAIMRYVRVHPEHEFYEPPGNAGIVVEPEMGKSFETKPGDSGSPVWDATTKALVGVVSAGVERTPGNEATKRATVAPVLGLPIKHPGRAPGILSALGGELKIELE